MFNVAELRAGRGDKKARSAAELGFCHTASRRRASGVARGV